MSLTFIADTETTGIDKAARVVEYAHLVCEEFQAEGFTQLRVVDQFESLVNPGIPIPAGATAVHGITDAMVSGAPDIRQVMADRLPERLNTSLIGHNFVKYDMQFLHPFVPKSYDVGCTLRLARQYLKDQPGHSLDKLRVSLGLPTEGRAHRALGDVYTTLALTNHILQMGMPWEQLRNDSMVRIDVMPWGKHKGTPISDLDDNYVEWLLANADAVQNDWALRRALQER